MASKLIRSKNIACYSCGSTLVRATWKHGVRYINCMVCCSGENTPSELEFMLNDGDTREVFGRESGKNSEILSRTNTPWCNASHYLSEANTNKLLINKNNRN